MDERAALLTAVTVRLKSSARNIISYHDLSTVMLANSLIQHDCLIGNMR